MLNKIIKKHPFKLIAGIMLMGSCINPANAADGWEKFGKGAYASFADDKKAFSSLVEAKDCSKVTPYFVDITPINDELKSFKALTINNTPVKVMAFAGGWLPLTEKGQDYVYNEFSKRNKVTVGGAYKTVTMSAKGFDKSVQGLIKQCHTDKAITRGAI